MSSATRRVRSLVRFSTMAKLLGLGVVFFDYGLHGILNSSPACAEAAVTLEQDTLVTGGGSGARVSVTLMALIGETVTGSSATASITHEAGYNLSRPIRTQGPSMPTVFIPNPVATSARVLLSGTKQAGTSIWINGVQMVAANGATTWQVWVTLVEGNNIFKILAINAAGTASASFTTTVILDKLPPVISALAYVDPEGQPLNLDPATSTPKTNFSSVAVNGQVDDNLTTVTINGVTATRAGITFQATVPIALGLNALTIHATSPNNYVTNQTVQVVQGTMPTITTLQPPPGTKLYLGDSVTVQTMATDAENDPLQYQMLLEGAILVNWMTGASYAWTPTTTHLGIHMLEIRVRDGFGGYASQQASIAVIHRPISPPQSSTQQ